MFTLGRSKTFIPFISLCALAITDVALAQNTLEEIVVTARKREESLSDVPIAITAFTEDFVKANSIASITDVSLYTPGLIAGNGTGETGGNLFLRGIGSGQLSALLDQSVSINIDGAQVGGAMMFASLMDMERIEVLRGPQALYFGKNSPGGVISIVTKGPTEELEATLKAGYENSARKKYASASVSGPLTDTLGGRLMAYHSTQDGHLKIRSSTATSFAGDALGFGNSRGPEKDNTVVRGALVFEPNDRLKVTGKITYAGVDSEDGYALNAQILTCPLGARQAWAPEYAAVEDCTPNDTIVTGDFTPEVLAVSSFLKQPTGYTDDDFLLTTIDIDYDINDHLSLASVTSYYSADVNMSTNYGLQPISFLASSTGLDMEQFSQEIRLLTDYDSPVNFLVGAYYETGDSLAYIDTNLVDIPTQTPFNLGNETTDQEKTAYSVFAQAMWKITDQVELDMGARYSYEEKDAKSRSSFVPGQVGRPDYDADNVSPEVTLNYLPTDDITLYVSYREGFKSGGIDAAFQAAATAILGGPSTYEEETVKGFEGGMKGYFLDRSLQANIAIFSYEYTDLQLSILDSDVLAVRVVNAAKASTSGAEFDFVWAPANIEGLKIQGALAYLDAEYDDYIADCYKGQSIGSGCSLVIDGVIKQDLGGTTMPLAPEFAGSLGFTYELPVNNNWTMSLSSMVEFSDDYQANDLNSPFGQQDSYERYNATLQLFSNDDKWELALIGRNLSDEFVVARSSTDTLTASVAGLAVDQPADYFGTVSMGREVYFEVTRHF